MAEACSTWQRHLILRHGGRDSAHDLPGACMHAAYHISGMHTAPGNKQSWVHAHLQGCMHTTMQVTPHDVDPIALPHPTCPTASLSTRMRLRSGLDAKKAPTEPTTSVEAAASSDAAISWTSDSSLLMYIAFSRTRISTRDVRKM